MGSCCAAERDQVLTASSSQAQSRTPKHSAQVKGARSGVNSPMKTKKKEVTVSLPVSPRDSNAKRLTLKQSATHRKGASMGDASGLRTASATPKPNKCAGNKKKLRECKTLSTAGGGVFTTTIKPLKTSIFTKYQKLSELHTDRVTSVFLARSRLSQQPRVVKILRKSHSSSTKKEANFAAEEQFRREVVTVSNLDHPNILKIFKLYEDKSSFYIVSEPANGGNLIDYITSTKCLSEVFAAKVMHQVFQVLHYCHSQGVVHRSIQPSCILLLTVAKEEDPVVKVTGFGNAHLLTDQERLTLSVSSAYYVAPETLKRSYSEKSDVWSCGITLYQLLNGSPPFLGQFVSDIVENILKKHLSFPQSQWGRVSREAIELVTAMLAKNPANRATIEECLNHPWIQRYKNELTATAPLVMNALANLQRFKVGQVLKQAILKFVSDEVGNSEETKELIKAFKAMDENGDGVLSREELISAYEKSMSRDRACYTVDHILKTIDTDNSGSIDFSEFMLASFNSKTILRRANLQLLFQLFDEDGSGKVSVEEIKEKVRMKDNSVSDELWSELVAQVDSNGDGELDFEEFSLLLKLAIA